MADCILKYHKEGNVISITFPSEPIGKELFETVHFEFSDLGEMILAEKDIRVCVLSGIGTQTFKWVTESRHGLMCWAECVGNAPSLSNTAMAMDVPLIVGMDGEIEGPGLELALFCDVRIATSTSRFRFPHAKMGWAPFDGATQMLPRVIGKSRSLELLLTGSSIDAETAYRIGLTHYIVNPGELTATLFEMSSKMAANSPTSLRYVKEAVVKGLDMTVEQGLRLEADLYFLSHSTEDRIEGISAFKEKRKPLFTGK